MVYSFDPIFAKDPSNPNVVASNASITIFDPADAGKAPIAITDTTGMPLPNPITVDGQGMGPAFQHPTLARVGWFGGGKSNYFTSYEDLKNEAVAARQAAENAAGEAGAAAVADLETRIAAGQFKGDPGQDGSNVVPTQAAIQSEVTTPGTPTQAALTATYASKPEVVPRWSPNTAYAAGDKVVSPSGVIVSAITAFTSGASYAAQNWASPSSITKPTAPAYIGGGARVKTWNPALHLYNGESATMRTIRSIVRKARAGDRKRIVAAGDSKTAGSGSTQPQVATNSYPAQLADLFGAKPGLIYANSWDTRWGSITGGVADAGGTSQNYMVAPAGSWSITFTSLDTFTGFKLFAYISPGGSINVTVDGVAQTAFAVAAGSTWKSTSYSGFADTTHTIVLSGAAATSILGIEPTYSTGLSISNAGRPSSSAAEWLLPTDWSRIYSAAFSVNNASLTPSKPDVALINIGTNTNASTLNDITTFITNVNSLGIPILLVAFGGVGSGGNYDNKRVRLYDLADSLDLPLLDFTSLIGDQPAATAAGLMQDTVHENTRGYALEADAVARTLAY